MIKNLCLILFIFYGFPGSSQKISTEKINSEYLKKDRNYKIFIPKGYQENDKKNYPLTIILDDDALFDIYVSNTKLFTQKDKVPQQIIVGIDVKKTLQYDIAFNQENGELTYNSEYFYTFLKDELIFHMESNYRTSPFITLVANGYAANFITHFLSEEIPIINSYICISPSFSDFIGNQLISYGLESYAKEESSYYFYTNNSSSYSKNKHQKIKQLQGGLSQVNIKNFNIINDSIPSFNTLSTRSEAIPRAMSKVFEIYSSITKNEYEKNIKHLAPSDAIEYLEKKYINIEFLFGTSIGIRERDIFAVESIIIEKENGDYLRDFGDMILKLYPTSPLGDYYIGKYYETGRRYKKALKYYKMGYGKIDPSDPNIDAYYENIDRINELIKN